MQVPVKPGCVVTRGGRFQGADVQWLNAVTWTVTPPPPQNPSCHYNTVSPWELNLLTIVFIFLFHIFLIIFFNSKRQSGRRNPSRIYHFPIRSAAPPPRPNNRNDLRLGTRLEGDRGEGGMKKEKGGGGERAATNQRDEERGEGEGGRGGFKEVSY